MAQAYTPGLTIQSACQYRARRILPIAGDVRVRAGERVAADTVVARTELPGDVTPLNVANLLAIPAADVPSAMLKREGEQISVGDPLARTKGVFGFFKNELASKLEGRIESISAVTGQVLVRGAAIPVEVEAYVAGTVTEVLPGEGCVIAAEVSLVQGIFGIGGEARGRVAMACRTPDQECTPNLIADTMRGAVVVGGARVSGATVRRAIEVGAAALVSGGIDDADLREILGYDLGVAITGTERIGLTLIITEGFGSIAMARRTFELLAARQGDLASVNGATQIRAGVMRPEIVIPTTGGATAVADAPTGVLEVGALVRIIRDPWFGEIGQVAELPSEPQLLESGSRARVLVVQRANRERVVVPRANVELAGG